MKVKKRQKKIIALIPCHNEEKGVGQVIRSFPLERLKDAGFDLEIMVIDNASTDRTAEVAQRHGATVLYEEKRGKGNAVMRGLRSVPFDADYIVMLDGDATYQASEVLRMVEPLESGFCTVVVGSRLVGKIRHGAMSAFNRLGNWSFSLLVRFFFNANITDVLTGYFAWTYDAVARLRPHLSSGDFGIEMDMVTKMAKLGEGIYSVPITYTMRSGESNLRPIRDGVRILAVFFKNMFWRPGVRYTTALRMKGSPQVSI